MSERPVQKRHFNQDFKKHFWSFIIKANQMPLHWKMQKKRKKETETGRKKMQL